MPFARSARITLTNEGKQSSRHWVEINYRTYQSSPADQLYFHAQYRQATPPPEGPYLILDAKGRGQLMGCVLSVKNNDGGWWGEGDEIVWIDGKHAMQGTGSEDYFCESYGLRAGCFPYFGVTVLEEPFTTAYRWHVPDPVTFRESMRFLIEHGNGSPPFRSGNYYYSVAYWYQTEPHAPFPKSAQRTRANKLGCPARAQGRLEGESMKILSQDWRDHRNPDRGTLERLEAALVAQRQGRRQVGARPCRWPSRAATGSSCTTRWPTITASSGSISTARSWASRTDFYSATNVTKSDDVGRA